MKTSDALENIIAVAEVLSDQIVDSITKSTKEAGKAIDIEITIKKLISQKTKKLYELGNKVYSDNKIDENLLKEIKDIDERIKQAQKNKEEL